AVTGGVITSAGVVLAATFAVLVLLPLVFLVEVAFTVALGVLLDTVVVRSTLGPALCHNMAPKIWWPSRLAASPGRPVRGPNALVVAAATVAAVLYTWVLTPDHLSIEPAARASVPHGSSPSPNHPRGSQFQPNDASLRSGGSGSPTSPSRP